MTVRNFIAALALTTLAGCTSSGADDMGRTAKVIAIAPIYIPLMVVCGGGRCSPGPKTLERSATLSAAPAADCVLATIKQATGFDATIRHSADINWISGKADSETDIFSVPVQSSSSRGAAQLGTSYLIYIDKTNSVTKRLFNGRASYRLRWTYSSYNADRLADVLAQAHAFETLLASNCEIASFADRVRTIGADNAAAAP